MRRRLVIAIVAVAAGAVVLFAVPLALVLQRSYRDEDLLRLQRDTIAVTRGIDVSSQRGDPIELPRTQDTLGVYDQAGRQVAGSGPPVAPQVVRSVLRSGHPADRVEGGHLVAAVPLLVDERVTGAVLAVRTDVGAARDTRGAWLVIAATCLALTWQSSCAAGQRRQ